MISALHNPIRDNGTKVSGPSGYKLPDNYEAAVESRVHTPLSNGITPRSEEPADRPELRMLTLVTHWRRTECPSGRVAFDLSSAAPTGPASSSRRDW